MQTHHLQVQTGLTFILRLISSEKPSSPVKRSEVPVEIIAPENKARNTGRNQSLTLTLNMFNEGKTIEEIIMARNLTQTAVEKHLIHAAESGLIGVTKLIDKKEYNVILSAIYDKGDNLELKEFFGDRSRVKVFKHIEVHNIINLKLKLIAEIPIYSPFSGV